MVAVKRKLRPVSLAPITQPGKITPITGAAAIIFRNAGSATVNLWGGSYTLDSKETLSLNVTEDFGTLDATEIPISFDTGTGPVQRLQILILVPSNC
jgi:hypothetical protein